MKPALDILAELNLKFTSGNDVPVTRATVTVEEWKELVKAVGELQLAANWVINCNASKASLEALKEASTDETHVCLKCGLVKHFGAFVNTGHICCPDCGHDLIGA